MYDNLEKKIDIFDDIIDIGFFQSQMIRVEIKFV